MNTSKLKTYAPKARTDFIAAVADRAALLGITPKKILPVESGTDVVVIGGTPWPKAVGNQREKLVEQIEADGFDRVMEAAAYSWFNRLVALRYMELHGYLDHGYRVIGNPDDPAGDKRLNPEILSHIEHVDDLPGLDRDEVVSLKLDSKDEALYRKVLTAQCNALHKAMPFLFEQLGDATELLLPDHLLRPDSILRQLVTEIPEEDWQQVEIIGWLYQFYISEKKDEVIGKTVKSEDIPAATQLFTPNWIVKYMVQNALGAQWLATYPDSPLKDQMDYYIEPAEQTPEVQAQLETITPKSLDPETLTLIDPACGSGHILVEAYDLFKAIYLERGYRLRDIPEKILRNNLFGLEIDPRATQLAGFALMMKARADDPRIFTRGDASTGGAPWMNVRTIVSSEGIEADAVYEALAGEEADEDSSGEFGFMEEIRAPLLAEAKRKKAAAKHGKDPGFSLSDIKVLLALFAGDQAQTYGSLIRIPDGIAGKLPVMVERADRVRHSGDLQRSQKAEQFFAIAEQAVILASRYEAAVANPPYMGEGGMNKTLKGFVKKEYPNSKNDLYGCFLERSCEFSRDLCHAALVTMHSWMFLSSFTDLREQLLDRVTIKTMAHLGARAFGSISGEVVSTTATIFCNLSSSSYRPVFFRLIEGLEEDKREKLAKGSNRYEIAMQRDFSKIPGSPVAYWVSDAFRSAFQELDCLDDIALFRQGMSTTAADYYERDWAEVDLNLFNRTRTEPLVDEEPEDYWYPFNKGGARRRWYGNLATLVRYQENGKYLLELVRDKYPNISDPEFVIKNRKYFFLPSVTYASLGSGAFYSRVVPSGCAYSVAGPAIFPDGWSLQLLVSLLCSNTTTLFLSAINPTLGFQIADVGKVPVSKSLLSSISGEAISLTDDAIEIATTDWNSFERSWDFKVSPLVAVSRHDDCNLASSYSMWIKASVESTERMKRLEESNNQLYINAYKLSSDIEPDVEIQNITLLTNPVYRYGKKVDETKAWIRFRQDTMQELVSYAIGCMMGRYSLDEQGLVYAHAGGEGFDASRYTTFPADDDGILPLTDTEWFDDDVCNRLIEFISKAWTADTLEENLNFLAENLSPKKNESSRDTIRRYLNDSFFKDHLQTYKKRPIYWLFTSGKLKAFQCLVYLHRYNPGTLSRMRTKYVLPLMGKLDALIQRLDGSTNLSTKDRKELDLRKKQLAEIKDFDEKLHHLADQRIALDLDDGVKVNYGKFSTKEGEILAEVSKIAPKKKKGK